MHFSRVKITATSVLVLLCIGVVACGESTPRYPVTVKGVRLMVEVAQTHDERALGLMHRDSLAENHGMLFIFEDVARRDFWMKDTRIPLTIAYMAIDGTIIELHDMEPYSLAYVSSRAAVPLALEVNQGWFARHGIRVGDRFDLSRVPMLRDRASTR